MVGTPGAQFTGKKVLLATFTAWARVMLLHGRY
jgi:hypothetical protein